MFLKRRLRLPIIHHVSQCHSCFIECLLEGKNPRIHYYKEGDKRVKHNCTLCWQSKAKNSGFDHKPCQRWMNEKVLDPMFIQILDLEVEEKFENQNDDEETTEKRAPEFAFDSLQWDITVSEEEESEEECVWHG